jgi:ABC-type Fe3+-hydroxamate transport system substrate-binding protein
MRIVSLVPSVTETLSVWNRDPVACTRFCERPDLPTVGGTKNPDVEKIIRLHPDLVIVDAEENRREDYDALVARGLDVYVLHVQSIADVNPSMSKFAERIGVNWDTFELPSPRPLHVRALVPIWRHPWIALGTPTYGASLLQCLGVITIFASKGHYPEFSLQEARRLDPDIVVAPSEPYPFTKRQLPELQSVAPTVFVDGKDLFWWGCRTRNALERLAAQLDHL